MTSSTKCFAVATALALTLCASDGAKKRQQSDSPLNVAREPSANESGDEVVPMSPVDEMASIQTETEDAMGAVRGRDVSDTWARKMIEHQKGAIRFPELLLRRISQPALRNVATKTIAQARQNLRAPSWVTETSLYRDESFDEPFVKPQLDIFQAMTIPDDKSFESTWVTKMIVFERGAVGLAGVAINQGDEGRVKESARQIAAQKANDAETMI
jgi:uncharacterized protein (DUF305 family)